jgi:hypothetical protein
MITSILWCQDGDFLRRAAHALTDHLVLCMCRDCCWAAATSVSKPHSCFRCLTCKRLALYAIGRLPASVWQDAAPGCTGHKHTCACMHAQSSCTDAG